MRVGNKFYKSLTLTVISAIVIIFTFIGCKNSVENKKVAEAERLYLEESYREAISAYTEIALNNEKSSKNLKYLDKAMEIAFISGELENYEKEVNMLLEKGQEDFNIYGTLILNDFFKGNIIETKDKGEDLLKKYPSNTKLVETMFLVYLGINTKDEILPMLETLEDNVSDKKDIISLANMYLSLGDTVQFYELLKKAYYKDGDNFDIYLALQERFESGEDKLIQEVENLYEHNKKEEFYKVALLKVYGASAKNNSKAKELLNSFSKKELRKLDIKLIKSEIMLNSHSMDEKIQGEEIIKELLKENPEDYRINYAMAKLYLTVDNEKALEFCKESIKSRDDFIYSTGYLIEEIYDEMNKIEKLEPYFRKSLFLQPYNMKVVKYIGDSYKDNNLKEDTLNWYKLLECYDRSNKELKYEIAMLSLNRGKELENLALKEKNVDIKNGYLVKSSGEVKEAISKLLELVEDESGDLAKYYRTIGTVYMLQNDQDKALEYYYKSYERDENNILTLNNLGAYYISNKGDVKKSLEYMDKAIKIKDKEKEQVSNIVESNYSKLKNIENYYYVAKHKEVISIPEFQYFY